ncbi:unnamed protein product [Ilex paraguariensis]|uniref:Uncharacterized protein n=1 Tax=Ilex paraguariensis TaxID=185542 RepID=A0ABC8UNJ7_9AQUA
MDDECGLHHTTEPLDKGFYSEDELTSRGDEGGVNDSQELDSDTEQRQELSEVGLFRGLVGTRLCSDSSPATFALSMRLLTCLSDLTLPIRSAFPSALIRWSISSMAALLITYFSSAHSSRLISPLLLSAGSSQLNHSAQAIGSLGSKYQLNYTLLQLLFNAAYTPVAFFWLTMLF